MVALKNGIIQNKDGHSFDGSTGTWEKSDDETPKPNDETPKPNDEKKQTDAKTPNQNAETPQPHADTPQPHADTPKPYKAYYNIDGKLVHISVDDLSHFNELRAQLASGTTLNDDLIKKIKPILAELHL